MSDSKAFTIAPKTVTVIEIGSTGIRLVVANLGSDGGFSILDRASKPVSLGRDVFTSGSISRASMRETMSVLLQFKELVRGYGVAPENVRVIGTSAMREADNRDTFIDRIALQTGHEIEMIEDVEENHYMYLAVLYALGENRSLLSRTNTLILEVGGGSTELMLLRRGKMVAAHSLRIGTIRLGAFLRTGSEATIDRYLEENLGTTFDMLETDMQLSSVRQAVIIGSDVRFMASRAGRDTSESCSVVGRAGFEEFVESLVALDPEKSAENLHIPVADAEDLLPGLAIARKFLERTEVEEVIVPNVSIREGILASMALGPDPEMEEELRRQVVASAVNLGRRYRFDEKHALKVASLALALFDGMKAEHGLDKRDRKRLEVAAILHDIGTFIRGSGHHHHSEYIISNSEIFGLHREDLLIVAITARYHRRNAPSTGHPGFMAMSREQRMVVFKLAALLRVADALDHGHGQRISLAAIEKSSEYLLLRPSEDEDYSLEKLALADKGDLFEEVFGLKVVLA